MNGYYALLASLFSFLWSTLIFGQKWPTVTQNIFAVRIIENFPSIELAK